MENSLKTSPSDKVVPMLSAEDVSVQFGGVLALGGVSLEVGQTGIYGLIGPNGAGKTTLFNILSGAIRCDRGSVRFNGVDISNSSSHQISRLGLRRTFQNLQLFESMTVLENLVVAQFASRETPLKWSTIRKLIGRGAALERNLVYQSHNQLEYLGIGAYAADVVTELPFGILRKVELARALVSQPKMLLLDEPTSGLSSEDRLWIAEKLADTAMEQGIVMLLVEHDMSFVMSICQEITVLDYGRVIARGTPAEVQAESAVIEAYLGTAGAGPDADGVER